MRVGNREIEVSNAGKVFFPRAGVTKGDLVDYYVKVADAMLPHVRDRVVAMRRFPDGVDGEGFFQKEVPDYFPDWIETVDVAKVEGGKVRSLICDSAAALAYCAGQGTIEFHAWLSRAESLEEPDRLVFDLDPPGGGFEGVRKAAFALRDLLDDLGLLSYVMTTGSRGCHVAVPLDGQARFDDVRSFAQGVARRLAEAAPKDFTTEQRIAKRGDRVFIDVARNSYGQTAVAPYSVRANARAGVATPLSWDELSDFSAASYTVENVLRRLGQAEDPWKDFARHARSLDGPRQGLRRLEGKEG